MKNNETIVQPAPPALSRHEANLARLLLHDDAESEDAVSEVFANLMSKDILPTGSTARTYLLTALRNHCLNLLRNRTIQERLQGLYLLDSQISGRVPTT